MPIWTGLPRARRGTSGSSWSTWSASTLASPRSCGPAPPVRTPTARARSPPRPGRPRSTTSSARSPPPTSPRRSSSSSSTRRRPLPIAVLVQAQLLDTVVHTWDVAAALGESYTPEPDVVDAVLRIAEPIPDDERREKPGAAFAHARETDGTPWERTLALLGRTRAGPPPRDRPGRGSEAPAFGVEVKRSPGRWRGCRERSPAAVGAGRRRWRGTRPSFVRGRSGGASSGTAGTRVVRTRFGRGRRC